jgi:hypothetical protein
VAKTVSVIFPIHQTLGALNTRVRGREFQKKFDLDGSPQCIHKSVQMSDELDEIFTTHLPSVAEEKRSAFFKGMRAYHDKFKAYREESMVYETGEQYMNDIPEITMLEQEDYWIYSPHFCRVFGLILNKVFKTKIDFISTPDISNYERGIVFLDTNKIRWTLLITPSVSEPEKIHIRLRFPRHNSNICLHSLASENVISQKISPVTILVTSTKAWYEPNV